MAINLLSSRRTVLMISDDALYIYTVTGRSVRLIEVVSWEEPTFVERVADILIKDCGSQPVLFLNDMVEQHYRKERMPKAGPLDKSKILKRKLKVSFPSYPVRAALKLKQQDEKNRIERSGGVYIFAAVPQSEVFGKVIAAVRKSLCPIAGSGLVPVESSGLVNKLSKKLNAKTSAKPAWSVFIGQHHSGGLRQIVTKNGELALTRMTPLTDEIEDAHNWARQVYHEFKATMSYLSRFGFSQEEGLDVIVVSDNGAGQILGDMIDVECNYHPLSLREASRIAGVGIGPQESQKFADPLHVAWAARKSKLLLPMQAKEIESISKPRKAAATAMVLLFLGAAFQGYLLADYYQGMQTKSSELEEVQIQQAELEQEYQSEMRKKEALGFDIRLVRAAVTLHSELEEKEVPALNLFSAIGRALGRDLRVDSLSIKRHETGSLAFDPYGRSQQKNASPAYTITFGMNFPGTTDIDRGNQEVSDLRDRLAAILPDHDVKVLKYLKDYEFVDELVIESGDSNRVKASQDFTASIQIVGPRI